jgi:hypothetical protein
MMQEEIQTAIFNRVSAIGYPTYDHVPQESEFPYIVIGDDTSIPWDTDDSIGSETTCTIHVWSRHRGRKEVKEIMRTLYEALHRAEFPIIGGALVECQAEFQESLLDPDGLTRHGVIRFRLTVDAAPNPNLYLATEDGALLQTTEGFYIVKD